MIIVELIRKQNFIFLISNA